MKINRLQLWNIESLAVPAQYLSYLYINLLSHSLMPHKIYCIYKFLASKLSYWTWLIDTAIGLVFWGRCERNSKRKQINLYCRSSFRKPNSSIKNIILKHQIVSNSNFSITQFAVVVLLVFLYSFKFVIYGALFKYIDWQLNHN